MFDTINLQENISELQSSPQFDGITKIILNVSDNVQYSAGTDTGRTLEMDCPFATQEVADSILEIVSGYQYQPFEATGAIIDPAFELGDGATIQGLYSGIYAQKIELGPLYRADISAPYDEEIDHEFKFEPESERKIHRSLKNLSSDFTVQAGIIAAEVAERKESDEEINSSLRIQSDQIEARVEKSGGNDSGSFGWTLESNEWRITCDGSTVLKANQTGLEVKGRVTATSGKIAGFEIIDDHISYNGATWGGKNTYGVYLGPQGIQLGSEKNGFKVDSSGNLYANNGHFRGSVDAGSIEYGGSSGYFDGGGISSGTITGGWSGEIAQGTISTTNTSGGINESLGYADFSNDVFNGWDTAAYVDARDIIFNNAILARDVLVYKDYSGETAQKNIITWIPRY